MQLKCRKFNDRMNKESFDHIMQLQKRVLFKQSLICETQMKNGIIHPFKRFTFLFLNCVAIAHFFTDKNLFELILL